MHALRHAASLCVLSSGTDDCEGAGVVAAATAIAASAATQACGSGALGLEGPGLGLVFLGHVVDALREARYVGTRVQVYGCRRDGK